MRDYRRRIKTVSPLGKPEMAVFAIPKAGSEVLILYQPISSLNISDYIYFQIYDTLVDYRPTVIPQYRITKRQLS
jgi:hypothetical protein